MAEAETHLIAELEELTQALYQTHISSSTTTRRTASLSLPRTTAPAIPVPEETEKTSSRSRSRRLSFTPWKSRQNLDNHNTTESDRGINPTQDDVTASASVEKKGLWNWKPIRALSHIGMQKISCLFSVEVIAAQGLPPSTNGLRLSVCVRKKETKNGAVQTMPSRVSQGSAEFEETLFLNCHVYCSKSQEATKFEPRPFIIYLSAVDAEELSFGTSSVDLSRLIQESVEKLSYEGKRVRQWDRSFGLSGKARGGELVVKLGFQIMEKDGGVGIYGGSEGAKIDRSNKFSYSFRRNQGKKSFSLPNPRVRSQSTLMADIQGMDDKTLVEKLEGRNEEDGDVIEFEVVDKGVEAADSENSSTQITRLTELDSIAEQIKALESKIEKDKLTKSETESQKLDSDEETVTIEFLHLLEEEEQQQTRSNKLKHPEIPPLHLDGEDTTDHRSYVPDLGKGLGCVVQTRHGGYLAATNPLDTAISKKESPKLAMQITKPIVLPFAGFELLRRMAALGIDELGSQLLALMPIDELVGKTAEQIAFEGIASAIIEGRSTEGATSSAARIVAAVKTMAAALTAGRRERIATGIWNIFGETEKLLTVEEAVAFSLQRIEAMAVEALKIQADVAEEDAPFEVSPSNDSPVSLEDWAKSDNEASTIAVTVVVQLRDPLRRFEAVGGPIVALIQATREENRAESDEEERRYRVRSVDVAGLRARTEGTRLSAWDGEKQRLTARQWLVAYNAKHRKKSNKQLSEYDGVKNGGDVLWSVSSRIVADMWLKSTRQPDIKFAA